MSRDIDTGPRPRASVRQENVTGLYGGLAFGPFVSLGKTPASLGFGFPFSKFSSVQLVFIKHLLCIREAVWRLKSIRTSYIVVTSNIRT